MMPYQNWRKDCKKTPEAPITFVAMQKSMSYTFPLFTLIIGINFASGLALYWLVFSNQTIQQVRSQGWAHLPLF
jgi:membrane protein insertase Oxa1/YidC/SpoIIIJ